MGGAWLSMIGKETTCSNAAHCTPQPRPEESRTGLEPRSRVGVCQAAGSRGHGAVSLRALSRDPRYLQVVPEHAACQTGFAVLAPTMQYALFNVGYSKYPSAVLYCTGLQLHCSMTYFSHTPARYRRGPITFSFLIITVPDRFSQSSSLSPVLASYQTRPHFFYSAVDPTIGFGFLYPQSVQHI